MKKIGDQFSFNSAFAQQKRESINILKETPKIKAFLDKHQLDETIIENHWIDFIEFDSDMNECEGCSGIEGCPKNFKGHQVVLDYTGHELIRSFQICPYGESVNQEMKMMMNIIRNVPTELLRTTFNDIDLNNNGNIVDILMALNQYIANPNSKGFYLYGEMGVGKTYIMAAFINTLAKKGHKCAFISVPELFVELKRQFNMSHVEEDILNDIKEVTYLVLDDLGAESLSSWSRDDILYTIVNDRMNRNLPTFFTSVFDLDDLLKHYMMSKQKEEKVKSMRIIERIKAISQPIELTGDNFR